MLENSGITPGSIKLEVTETALMKDPAKGVAALEACRRLGATIAVDDFGTGLFVVELHRHDANLDDQDRSKLYSIDDRDTASRKIVQMILRLADALEIPVVAEGVEKPNEGHLLSDLGCALAQGYLFGKAEPLARTLEVIRDWRSLEEHDAPIVSPQTEEGDRLKP